MRPLLFAALLVPAAVAPACAQEPARPNTLTPQEIADGWILLFDGETPFGWSGWHPTWWPAEREILQVKEGSLDLGGMGEKIIGTTTTFERFDLRFEYQCAGDGGEVVLLSESPAARLSRALPATAKWTECSIHVERDPDGIGNRATFRIPGLRSPPSFFPALGHLLFVQGSKAALRVRSIRLRPLGMTALFNGKDLAGWRAFPGKKSEFSVEDGAIRVKGGPGDLQTDATYADFVLQIECRCNGKSLNSGVFFRCKANEYQNGYEAQIQNDFSAFPRKYVVEIFDPYSHKSSSGKYVLSAAVDYGTGAIYRRVPARKGVAKDGEWFTMTVVARGNHFATWVNGIQQVDWTDNRPPSDNPRTGFRGEAGHLSIQGHDATTDLSLRNLRIAELVTK